MMGLVSHTQFFITMAVAPVLSPVIVLAGYKNSNLNARTSELRNELKDLLRAELAPIRAEMACNHSEVLAKFSELDRRLNHLEAKQ